MHNIITPQTKKNHLSFMLPVNYLLLHHFDVTLRRCKEKSTHFYSYMILISKFKQKRLWR